MSLMFKTTAINHVRIDNVVFLCGVLRLLLSSFGGMKSVVKKQNDKGTRTSKVRLCVQSSINCELSLYTIIGLNNKCQRLPLDA